MILGTQSLLMLLRMKSAAGFPASIFLEHQHSQEVITPCISMELGQAWPACFVAISESCLLSFKKRRWPILEAYWQLEATAPALIAQALSAPPSLSRQNGHGS